MRRQTLVNGPLVLNGQGYDYSRVEQLTPAGHGNAVKVRVRVHIDTSYAKQSWAITEKWDGDKWNEVLRWIGNDPVLELPYVSSGGAGQDKAETAMAALVSDMVRQTSHIVL